MDLGGHLLWRIGSPFQSIGKMSKSLVFHGESAGLPRRHFFLGKRKLLAGARGKTSLEERFSISKWWFSGQRVWYSWMALGAKLLL